MSGDIWAYSEFINFRGGRPLQRQGVEGGEGRGRAITATLRSDKELNEEGGRKNEGRKEAIKSLSEHN